MTRKYYIHTRAHAGSTACANFGKELFQHASPYAQDVIWVTEPHVMEAATPISTSIGPIRNILFLRDGFAVTTPK